MFKKNIFKKIIFSIIIYFFLISTTNVLADPNYDPPSSCPDTYVPNFECINQALIDPSVNCDINKCPNNDTDFNDLPRVFQELNVFGTQFRIDSERRTAAFVNLMITTLFGLISVYTLGRGLFVGVVKRTQAMDAEAVAAVTKELTQLAVGFLVSFSSIFIMQLVFSLLGLGSLNEVILVGTPTDSNIIIN